MVLNYMNDPKDGLLKIKEPKKEVKKEVTKKSTFNKGSGFRKKPSTESSTETKKPSTETKLKKPVIENGQLPKYADVKKYFKSIGKELSEAQTYYKSLVAKLGEMKKKGKTDDNKKSSTDNKKSFIETGKLPVSENKKSSTENKKSSTESSTEDKKPLTTLLAENKDKDVIASVGKTLLSKLKKGKKMKRTSSGFRPIRRK